MLQPLKQRLNTIFSRLFITFLLIITPLYVLGIGIYTWGVSTIQDEIRESLHSKARFLMDNMDASIQKTGILQYDCLNDENLQELAHFHEIISQPDQVKSVLKLKQRLYAIQTSSEFIEKVSVHIPSLNRTLSSNGAYHEINGERLDFLTQPQYDGSLLRIWQGRLMMSAASPLILPKSHKKPTAVIEIELSNRKIQGALAAFNQADTGGSVLYSDDGRFVVYGSEDGTVEKRLMQLLETPDGNEQRMASTLTMDNHTYVVVKTHSERLGLTLLKYSPAGKVYEVLDLFVRWFWLFSLVSLALIAFYSSYTYKLVQKPLTRLVKAFSKVEGGDLEISLAHKGSPEFGYLFRGFNEMVRKLHMLITQVYEQKILVQSAQLKQLQSQINPHFLYNSFFILHRMLIMGDNANAILFSKQLGNYFKFITRSAADEVPLSKELEHAAVYAEIQAMRFSRRLTVQIGKLPENAAGLIVPRLILQPLIENAIEHGLKSRERDGLLEVRFVSGETGLEIIVEDNGTDLTGEELHRLKEALDSRDPDLEITGMVNIHRRLRSRFGGESGLRLERGEGGGMKASLMIETGLPQKDAGIPEKVMGTEEEHA